MCIKKPAWRLLAECDYFWEQITWSLLHIFKRRLNGFKKQRLQRDSMKPCMEINIQTVAWMVINDAQPVRRYGSNILHFERVREKMALAIMPHSALKYIRPFLNAG